MIFLSKALEWLVQPILTLIQSFAGFLFEAAGVLFAWVVDPNNLTQIVASEAVLTVWTTVRDFVNMFFILVLLFSAFATVFQLKNDYNIKNIFLNVIIMALLVNFSFPIARIVIDISNVIMYEILNQMFDGNPQSFASALGSLSKLTQTMMPKGDAEMSSVYQIISIIFLLLFAVTMLVIAMILLIRLVMLAMLVMLSPIGFVGNIFPGKPKEFARNWWAQFLKYCFSGPVLAFFLAMSLVLMKAVRQFDQTNVIATNMIGKNDQAIFIAKIAFMITPLVMLWAGMGMAGKSGVAGAQMVAGWGKGFSKWAGKLPSRATRAGLERSGIAGGYRQVRDDYRKKGIPLPLTNGRRFGGSEKRDERKEERSARMAAKFGVKDAEKKYQQKKNRDDIKKNAEDRDMVHIDDLIREMDQLKTTIASGNATKDDYIKFAGAQKQAQSRGKEYEDALEAKLKSDPVTAFNKPEPPAIDESVYMSLIQNPPRPADPSYVTPTEDRAIKAWEAQVASMEKQKQASEDWKKEEKEHYQRKKAERLTDDRQTVRQSFQNLNLS